MYYAEDETIERAFVYKKRPNKFRSFYETKLAKKIVQLEVILTVKCYQIFSHGGRGLSRKSPRRSTRIIKFESLEGPFLLVMEENKQYITIAGYEYIEEKNASIKSDERSQFPTEIYG